MPPPRITVSSLARPCHACVPSQTSTLRFLPLLFLRPASHAAQGRANKAAPGPGKRLGAKKSALELVVPGNIIFRQRGTHWFPGENCDMGRDHTIFAKEKGYVTYYRDPELHPRRKYIGVVFERGMKLPVPRNAPRRRRLGLVGRERELTTMAGVEVPESEGLEVGGMTEAEGTFRQQPKEARSKVPDMKRMELRPGYQYRESNYSIGRTAERAGVKMTKLKSGSKELHILKRKAKKEELARRAMGKKQTRQKKGKSKGGNILS